ncbi:MAG: hypothetical protein R3E86_03490 [Pseudomonadales bacterium]
MNTQAPGGVEDAGPLVAAAGAEEGADADVAAAVDEDSDPGIQADTEAAATTALVVAPTPDPATNDATVWGPFRSQRSALGFAEHLSRSLDHAFEVSRRGPGRYEVYFDYATDAERDALLQQIGQLTGARP